MAVRAPKLCIKTTSCCREILQRLNFGTLATPGEEGSAMTLAAEGGCNHGASAKIVEGNLASSLTNPKRCPRSMPR